jgi:flagellar hook-associated protein 3 FlgL
VSETEQYIKNVAQGVSWTEVTEAAFKGINNLLADIRYLTVRAATDTLTYEDRQKMMTDIASLSEQIGLEMNVTYAGRYVFSGYRTDQPPVIMQNEPNLSYLGITQAFTAKDVQYTKVYLRDSNDPSNSITKDVAVIKLAYTDLTDAESLTFIDPATGLPVVPAVPINVVSIDSFDPTAAPPVDPYQVNNYIQETGELVLAVDGNQPAATDIVVRYDILTSADGGRGGIRKGELNPQVYFDCIDNTVNSPTFGKHFNASNTGPPPTPGIFDRQHFEFEFSINTRVRINANAPDVFSANMYADYQALLGYLKYVNEYTKEDITQIFYNNGLRGEELEDAVAQEMQRIQDALQDRFSGLIGLVDKHVSAVSTEHTDMGSRMRRLELIEMRLRDDRIAYTKLMSENEDVDFSEALMKLSSLQAIYQASLATGASIMKLTLADYV